MAFECLFEDEWGAILLHADAGVIEIRWYDATRDLDGEGFNRWLARFAGEVEKHRPRGALVDAVQFRMDPGRMSAGWRDEHIIPVYDRAGLAKFAFLMPQGMPAIGKPPAPEGPARFPTAYFGTRREALAWLTS